MFWIVRGSFARLDWLPVALTKNYMDMNFLKILAMDTKSKVSEKNREFNRCSSRQIVFCSVFGKKMAFLIIKVADPRSKVKHHPPTAWSLGDPHYYVFKSKNVF